MAIFLHPSLLLPWAENQGGKVRKIPDLRESEGGEFGSISGSKNQPKNTFWDLEEATNFWAASSNFCVHLGLFLPSLCRGDQVIILCLFLSTKSVS